MNNEERKKAYEERKANLAKNCPNCRAQSFERCNSCIWGKRLRWLEAEYSDVTGWNHKRW